MRTVITMTSWKKRINYVSNFIIDFFNTQTQKPDLFYLFLAIDEFPSKECELPNELLSTIKKFNIQLTWVQENEYAHKRWYVYPKHYEDLVISIDEDQIYDNDMIKDAYNKSMEYIGKNVTFNIFNEITFEICFNNSIEFIKNNNIDNIPSILYNITGTHIFPPKTFPLDALKKENLELRKKYCVRCDESWLMPFMKLNNTKTIYLNNKSKVGLLEYGHIDATYEILCQKYKGIKVRDIQLYLVLRLFPKLMESWKNIYHKYNTKNFDIMQIDDIIHLIKNIQSIKSTSTDKKSQIITKIKNKNSKKQSYKMIPFGGGFIKKKI